MKKILTLFAIVGLVAFTSCEGPEGPMGPPGYDGFDGESANKVFEILNKDFGFNEDDGFNISGTLNPRIADASTVLVYRLIGTVDGNANIPIWQLIPRTIYIPDSNQEVDYDFDFSKVDFKIYVRANYDLETTPEYLDNQTFRIIILPASFIGKSVSKTDYSDYNAVIKKYNIDDSNVQKLN